MRVVMGVDGAKTATGIAIVQGDGVKGPPALVMMEAVLDLGSKPRRGWERLARAAGLAVGLGCDRLLIEAMPERLKEDQHGSHTSGAGPALVQGLALAAGFAVGLDGELVSSSARTGWRKAMKVLNARWGGPDLYQVTTGPVRLLEHQSEPSMVRMLFACGHEVDVWRKMIPHAAPSRCAQCVGGAMDARERHKVAACLFVATHWPEQYQELVAAAAARARTVKPDHAMSGVSDACEAVGITMAAYSP